MADFCLTCELCGVSTFWANVNTFVLLLNSIDKEAVLIEPHDSIFQNDFLDVVQFNWNLGAFLLHKCTVVNQVWLYSRRGSIWADTIFITQLSNNKFFRQQTTSEIQSVKQLS